ncbi:MAG: hypothetical protein AAGJ52_09910 [Pseudomonadota bacterium]
MDLSIFVMPHVIAGVFALILFWMAVFNRKGTALHRRIGQAYLLSMALIVVTGVPLTIKAYLDGYLITAVFLGYLLILVSHGGVTALRSIRLRHDREAFLGPFHRAATAVLALAGIAVIVLGWGSSMAFILVPFGAIGALGLIGLIRDLRRSDIPKNWWLREHFGALIGNGIATHIAFSQIGLARIFPGQGSVTTLLGWLLPLIIGLAAIQILDRRYGKSAARIPGHARTATAQSQ